MEEQTKNSGRKPNWLTANRSFYPQIRPIRDDLKNEMTHAEKLLWEKLRNKKLGVKFRRQHIIDCYIPDFVALSIKLIIEVDGKIHLQTRQRDKERTEHLEMLGYKVIRFRNEEIEKNIDRVVSRIRNEIERLKDK